MKLPDQVAIVVGSARGIGAAIARTFSEEGAAIVLVDLEKMNPQLDEVAQEINQKGGKAIAIVADVTDDRQVNQMIDEPYGGGGELIFWSTALDFEGLWYRCKRSRNRNGIPYSLLT